MRLVDGFFPCILSIYFGGITIALAVIGGVCADNKRYWSFSLRIFLLVFFLGSLLLSLGRFLSFFREIYEYVPFITVFRFPIKFLSAGIFPIALLAGYAIEQFLVKERSPKASKDESDAIENLSATLNPSKVYPSFGVHFVLWSILFVLSVVIIAFIGSKNFANHFQEFFFGQVGGDLAVLGVQHAWMHTLAFWAVMTLLYQYRQVSKRAWQRWVLTSILVIDLFLAGKQLNPTAPREFLSSTPAIVQSIQAWIGDGRFFLANTSSNVILRAPSNDIIWRYRWNLETLDSLLAAFFRIPFIFS